jgi:hypothetical protein
MIIYTHQRSRKRKPTAKQRQLQAEWEELVNRTKLNNKIDNNVKPLVNNKRYIRETEYIPSKDTGYYNTFKKADLYYTGDNMKGIGTLHKSNAVPIFTDEEAKDQAKMRR